VSAGSTGLLIGGCVAVSLGLAYWPALAARCARVVSVRVRIVDEWPFPRHVALVFASGRSWRLWQCHTEREQ
jgi:Na+-transporting NADH:ubiquinone oxidoreductase subunit NqrE